MAVRALSPRVIEQVFMSQKEQLASLSRTSSSPGSGRKRNVGSLLLLLAFVAGVALVFILVFGKRLQPRVEVTVTPAVLLESNEAAPVNDAGPMGSMLAQASGWIEPDPFVVRVPVKVDGFVEEVFIYAGDAVKRGQLLATLDPTNHALRVDQLKASLEKALQDAAVTEAVVNIAVVRHREAEDRLRRLRVLEPGDSSEVEVIETERAEAEARSVVETRLAEQARQEAEVVAIRTELAQAKVDLDRTQITSPMDGIVLRRFAAPGMKRMANMDDPESSTIVTLYDPERLQVRVDVPLSDAGRVVTGMPAKMVTASLPGQVFTGHVTRITGEADITRNTLQVKVALDQPDPAFRPEMLCRVEFFSSPSGDAQIPGRTRQVWLSERALAEGAEVSTKVWVVDPVKEIVSSREVEVAAGSRDGLRLVYRGLRPGEQVVVESQGRLETGTRVSVNKDAN